MDKLKANIEKLNARELLEKSRRRRARNNIN